MQNRLSIIRGGRRKTRTRKIRMIAVVYRGHHLDLFRAECAYILRDWRQMGPTYTPPTFKSWRVSPALTDYLDYRLRNAIRVVGSRQRLTRATMLHEHAGHFDNLPPRPFL